SGWRRTRRGSTTAIYGEFLAELAIEIRIRWITRHDWISGKLVDHVKRIAGAERYARGKQEFSKRDVQERIKIVVAQSRPRFCEPGDCGVVNIRRGTIIPCKSRFRPGRNNQGDGHHANQQQNENSNEQGDALFAALLSN